MPETLPALNYDDLVAPIRGTRFHTLRPGQQVVLTASARAADALSDIAVELPTGAGKTLIALLVLDYWRRQGITRRSESRTKSLGR